MRQYLLQESHRRTQSHRTAAGNYQNDDMLANVCKHNVTRFPYEIDRLAQDMSWWINGDDASSEKDFRSPETGPLLEKYLKGRKGVCTENRVQVYKVN